MLLVPQYIDIENILQIEKARIPLREVNPIIIPISQSHTEFSISKILYFLSLLDKGRNYIDIIALKYLGNNFIRDRDKPARISVGYKNGESWSLVFDTACQVSVEIKARRKAHIESNTYEFLSKIFYPYQVKNFSSVDYVVNAIKNIKKTYPEMFNSIVDFMWNVMGYDARHELVYCGVYNNDFHTNPIDIEDKIIQPLEPSTSSGFFRLLALVINITMFSLHSDGILVLNYPELNLHPLLHRRLNDFILKQMDTDKNYERKSVILFTVSGSTLSYYSEKPNHVYIYVPTSKEEVSDLYCITMLHGVDYLNQVDLGDFYTNGNLEVG